MTTKKFCYLLACLIVAASLTVMLTKRGMRAQSSGTPITSLQAPLIHPLTMYIRQVSHMKMPAPDGRIIDSTVLTEVFAIRSDGATVTKIDSAPDNGKPVHERFIKDYTNSLTIRTFDDVVPGLRSTVFRLTDRRVDLPWDPSQNCAKYYGGGAPPSATALVGTTTVAGFRAAQLKDATGTVTTRALDYGCVLMTSTPAPKADGSQLSERVIDRFVPGEPDPALYAVDSSYVEVAPSQGHVYRATAQCANPTNPSMDAVCQMRLESITARYKKEDASWNSQVAQRLTYMMAQPTQVVSK